MPLETLEQGPNVKGMTIENPRRQPKWFDVEKEFDVGMWEEYEDAIKKAADGNAMTSEDKALTWSNLKLLSPAFFQDKFSVQDRQFYEVFDDTIEFLKRVIYSKDDEAVGKKAGIATSLIVLDPRWQYRHRMQHVSEGGQTLYSRLLKNIQTDLKIFRTNPAAFSSDPSEPFDPPRMLAIFRMLYPDFFGELDVRAEDWPLFAKYFIGSETGNDVQEDLEVVSFLKIACGKDPLPKEEMLQLVEKGRHEAERIIRETPNDEAPFLAFDVYLYLKIISASRIEIPPRGGLVIGPPMQDEIQPVENEPPPERLNF